MASSPATTSSDAALAAAFGRPAPTLIAYLTAGFPDRDASREAIRAAGSVADILEVGIPFSDPMADGPTIQRASARALQAGMTLDGVFSLVREAAPACPVVLFGYLNPILRAGAARYAARAADLGVAGTLLTDLPAGADPLLEEELQATGVPLIRLATPVSTEARLRTSLAQARGFVYLVSRLGVTGARRELAPGLADAALRVRAATALPVAAGFGIATAAAACAAAAHVDGVVVGSALVDRLDDGGVPAMLGLLTELRTALDEAAPCR